jgi:superfamily I DNA/RNA helicase
MLMMHNGKLKIDENKVFILALKNFEKLTANLIDENKYSYCHRVSRLVDMFRMTLADLNDNEALIKLAIRFDIELFGNEIEHAKYILDLSTKICHERIDFCDMIYIPVIKDMKVRKYDYVYVDEMQDLNRAQQELVRKIRKPISGRMIAVGDSRQSIYGFAGADLESFNRMKNMFPSTIELPLSVCYRCAKNIVTKAQSIVSHIEPFEGQIDGEERFGSYKEIQDKDWVLCRNTKPLVLLFTMLIMDGKKAYIKGREIGKDIINFATRRKKLVNIDNLLEKLKEERLELKIKLVKKRVYKPEEDKRIVNFDEKVGVIKILTETNGLKTISQLVKVIEKIFVNDSEGICLSTIHKAKGGEADRVFVLMENLLPSKYAVTEDELLQEENLRYVLYTRAKSSLIFINDFTIEK